MQQELKQQIMDLNSDGSQRKLTSMPSTVDSSITTNVSGETKGRQNENKGILAGNPGMLIQEQDDNIGGGINGKQKAACAPDCVIF